MIGSRSLRAAALAVALTVVPTALAADGDLDPGFGTGGVVLTAIPDAQLGARAAVAQPDGKYVVAGRMFSFPAGSQIIVLRYNPDGTLDGTFGSGGYATTSFGTISESVTSVALMADGDILVAGAAIPMGGPPSGGLARFDSDGALDETFGIDGKHVFVLDPTGLGGVSGMAVDDAGRIVLTGGGVVARLNGDGSLDTTFAGDGTAELSFGERTVAAKVELSSDGRILVSGSIGSPPTTAFVSRLQADGVIDPTFGASGVVELEFGGSFNTAARLTAASDGGVLVAAQRSNLTGAEAVVVRLTSTGALDSSFGGDGTVVLPTTSNLARVLVQRDGKLFAVGSGGDARTGLTEFITTRLNPDGMHDRTFGGGDGVATTFVGLNGFAADAALTPAGLAVFGQNRNEVAIVRYTIAMATRFATFDGRATVGDASLDLKAAFTLGSGSNGIDPSAEAIELELGESSATIDGSALTRNSKGVWKYEGRLFGADADVQLVPTGAYAYELKVVLSKLPFALAAPLDVRVAIGDDEGSGVARIDD